MMSKREIDLSKRKTIWEDEELSKEEVRALFVIGVVGSLGVVRFAKIAESFSKSFNLLEPINVIDILTGFLIAYLILMVFAISDDIVGCVIAEAARTSAYAVLFFGFLTTFAASIVINYFQAPSQTIFLISVLVLILFLYGYNERFRKYIRERLGPLSSS